MCETEAFTLKTANSSDSYLAPSDDTLINIFAAKIKNTDEY